MTKQEFKKAFKIANSDRDLYHIDDSTLFGFGLKDFQPVHTTLDAVAKIILYQGRMLNGNWNMEAVDEVAHHGRRKFIIIG